MRGFDRPFLRSLAKGAAAGKLVLGEILSGEGPSPGQRIAVGRQKNIRPLNVFSDPDDVVRRVPLMFRADGEQIPSMALELAARALDSEPLLADKWTRDARGLSHSGRGAEYADIEFRGRRR